MQLIGPGVFMPQKVDVLVSENGTDFTWLPLYGMTSLHPMQIFFSRALMLSVIRRQGM